MLLLASLFLLFRDKFPGLTEVLKKGAPLAEPLAETQQSLPEIEKGLKRNPKKFLPLLVRALVKGERNPRRKVRLIHDWVATHISYDVKGLSSPKKSPTSVADVLRTGKSVCHGFANLFQRMCEIAGIKAVTITGVAKGYGYDLTGKLGQHAWNAVKIDGEWLLVDVTWDAGYVDERGKYVKEYSTDYLFLEPEAFIYTHFPDDPKWQLISPPFTLEQFKNLPNLKGRFFRLGMRLLSGPFLRKDGIFEASILAPLEVLLVAEVFDKRGRKRDFKALAQRDLRNEKVYKIFAIAPESGPFKIRLFAEKRGEKKRFYRWVGDLEIGAERVRRLRGRMALGLDLPQAFETFTKRNCRLIEPLGARLLPGDKLRLRLLLPNATEAFVESPAHSLEPLGGGIFEGEFEITSWARKVVVYAHFSDMEQNKFWGILAFRVARGD